jgi:catechol 2,3-dioxygenase-like lactoylglutathione lyase family enzyme
VTAATLGRRQEAPGAASGAFARVVTQLDALVAAFGLGAQAPLVHAVFDAICGRTLDFPLGGRPPAPSRLNEDGTPVQFATGVGSHTPALRFVADPGACGAGAGMRGSAARAAMRATAGLIGAKAGLAALSPLLLELAPGDAPALRGDPAGPFWIGAAFAPGAAPRLRVYVNGACGSPAARCARLRRFAAHFDRSEAWDELAAQFPSNLEPLGLALTLGAGGEVRGAIYLRAFGLRLSDYAALANIAAGPSNAERMRAFGTALLGADAAHPTPSAVLSFGFGPEPGLSAELEFCAHCLYADDTTAQAALERLFASERVDAAPYRTLARILAAPAPRPGPPRLHAFIGVDAKSPGRAYTVYMKPDLSLPI